LTGGCQQLVGWVCCSASWESAQPHEYKYKAFIYFQYAKTSIELDSCTIDVMLSHYILVIPTLLGQESWYSDAPEEAVQECRLMFVLC